MGYQIIKQPDGKLCVFSSFIDDFIIVDSNATEIINAFVEQERKQITAQVNRVISQLEKGTKPYYQFTMTYKEALRKSKKTQKGQ